MPLWTDAYLGDTRHLSTLQHGAYLLLLIIAWRSGGSLPDDDKLLARYTGLTGQQWARNAPTIREFFAVEGGRLVQKKLSATIAAVRRQRERQSYGGHVTALKNKEKGSGEQGAYYSGKQVHPKPKPKLREKEQPNGCSKKSARTLPKSWTPKPFESGKAKTIIDGWTEDRYNREVEAFIAHHGSRANAMVDWQQAWRTWTLNADKFDRSRSNGASTDRDRTIAAAEGAFGPASGWTDDTPF